MAGPFKPKLGLIFSTRNLYLLSNFLLIPIKSPLKKAKGFSPSFKTLFIRGAFYTGGPIPGISPLLRRETFFF